MWNEINLILIILGICVTAYGWKIGQEPEAFEAIFPFYGGIILALFGIASAAVKGLFF